MKRITLGLAFCILFGSSSVALADPTCTAQPEVQWLSIEDAKSKVEEMGYRIKEFKKTGTGCYELYGYTAKDKRIEIYFDPTNMNKVKVEMDD
ncbi:MULTISPECIES: PepSY domain-containing protein [unclassified Vibrio]|uniref:PepSY domain-containing protein n=1 Tax=unclassified Vibrio TaxID=2614977 RepID=UPI001360D76E|nr:MULTISPECIES: PepSY domain-containing protein [unclassified Vibrio]NAW58716.1 PepSY domain-containing protein [Vibrio sp. V36_P2S2PM302]NAX21529.1 PepSY domain-containing protein [Vibrio sp. V39_P1S14PM300]NAX26698.1 PepSY domain-containing protein [Vibrio sp. V38_P2S17PM301]NAX29113.1 PepSY domain-containing protein [Vibrio sp. V37_P2S8PM304]